MADARYSMLLDVGRMNRILFKDNGLQIVYMESCSTSWFEVTAIETEPSLLSEKIVKSDAMIGELEMKRSLGKASDSTSAV